MKQTQKYTLVLLVAVMIFLQSCSKPGGNNTGSEYMPDMAHSVAYEANYYNYYYNNTWGSEEDYYKYAQPRLPVKGTIPRKSSKRIAIPSASEGKTYYYGDTEEERTRATNEIIDNPLAITDAGLSLGKELYNINCAVCHGTKGDGAGGIVESGIYPVQPAILTNDEFVSASNGRYYHSIMHGKNLMGSYRDKLSYSERWQVIHYIRSLQAKEKGLVYNQNENTLNSIDRPAGDIKQVAELVPASHDSDNHGHGAHDNDHGHDDHGHDDHDGHDDDHHHEDGHHDDEHHDNH